MIGPSIDSKNSKIYPWYIVPSSFFVSTVGPTRYSIWSPVILITKYAPLDIAGFYGSHPANTQQRSNGYVVCPRKCAICQPFVWLLRGHHRSTRTRSAGVRAAQPYFAARRSVPSGALCFDARLQQWFRVRQQKTPTLSYFGGP